MFAPSLSAQRLRFICFLFCGLFLVNTPAFAAKPVVSNISATVNAGSSVQITLSGVDNDRNERLNFSFTNPKNGSLKRGTATSKTLIVTYTPKSGYVGSDSFTYKARDRTGQVSRSATVTITVAYVNVAPVAQAVTVTVVGNTSADVTLIATDIDSSTLSYAIVTGPQHGSASVSSAVAHYVPQTGFVGEDTFTYLASDGLANSSPASVSVTVTAPVVEIEPIPFGFWGLNGFVSTDGLADVASRFNANIFQVASSAPHYTATSLLPLVRASGMQVTLRMTDGHSAYTTDGSFDLQKWKDQITRWKTSCEADASDCIQTYIDDGTLAGHMLLDDIFTFTGNDPTGDELDEMARYSNEIFPGLMTFVRNKASTMPRPSSGTYIYLDACVNQYTNYQGYSDGPIATYAAQQAAAAASLDLDVINGLNIANGGDGSSGVTGWSSGKYAMSADEITTYGTEMLNRNTFPDLLLFLMWEYDGEELWSDGVSIGSDYFDQPELQNAIYELSLQAAGE